MLTLINWVFIFTEGDGVQIILGFFFYLSHFAVYININAADFQMPVAKWVGKT